MKPAHIPAVPTSMNDDTPNGDFLRASGAAPLAEVLDVVARGADLGAVSQGGETALLLASRLNDDPAVAHYLIGQGLSLTARDEFNRSPLHGFAAQGADDLVRLALEAGMPVNAPCCSGSPLIVAAEHARASTVRLLLGAGADCAGADEDGMTALHVASTGPVIDALIAAGAPLEARNRAGATPLMVRARRRGTDDCTLLLNLGARLDARDDEGWTALHYAHSAATIEALLRAGAEIDAPNKFGDTALLVNVKHGMPGNDACLYLVRAGADVNVEGSDGKSALVHAAENSDLDLFLLLLESDAQPAAALEPVLQKDTSIGQAYAAWRAQQAMQAALRPGGRRLTQGLTSATTGQAMQ